LYNKIPNEITTDLTDYIESYIMFSMSSCEYNENKRRSNEEISRLSKYYSALHIDYKKRVLKTAQGLLKIQRNHKDIVAGSSLYPKFSKKYRNYGNYKLNNEE